MEAKRGTNDTLPSDPVIEAYKKHVDRTLIRQNMAMLEEDTNRG